MSNNLSGFVLPAASIGLSSLLVRPQRGFFPPSSAAGPTQALAFIPIVGQITIEELHSDDLEITDHPVEQGASVSDHAYKRPAEVVIKCGWSNSPSSPQSFIGTALATGIGGFNAVSQPSFGASIALGALSAFPGVSQSVLTGNSVGQVKQIYAQLLALQAARIPFNILTGKRSYTSMLFRRLETTTDKENENSMIVIMHCKQVVITSVQAVSIGINPSAQADPQATTPQINKGVQASTDASSAIPNEHSIQGSSAVLNAQASNISSTFMGLTPTEMSGLPIVVQQIPALMASVSSQVSGVLNVLSPAAELPLSAEQPLSFGTTLNGSLVASTPGSASVASSLTALSNFLSTTRLSIYNTIRTAQNSILPAALSGLTDQLYSIQSSMANVEVQAENSFSRAGRNP